MGILMTSRFSRRIGLAILALLASPLIAANADIDVQLPAEFEVVAHLRMPEKDHFPGNHFFRSVALNPPWIYALDRKGSLYVFRLPEEGTKRRVAVVGRIRLQPWNGRAPEADPCAVVRNVGDGYDLKLFGQTLACTRHGGLEIYSLKDPQRPVHVGFVGPAGDEKYFCPSIIRDGTRAFVVGRGVVVSYDFAASCQPKCVSLLKTDCWGWCGCVSGIHLYVGNDRSGQRGIAVFDASHPDSIKEVGHVRDHRLPYHLFALPGNMLLGTYDARRSGPHIRTMSNITVDGTSVLFSLAKPTSPVPVREFPDSGGRAATVLATEDGKYLLGDGVVFAVADQRLKECFSFYMDGSTLDGFPYHGDSVGPYAALPLDCLTVVVRVKTAGDAAFAKGETDTALAAFNAAIRLDPANGKAYHKRANVRIREGDVGKAVADFAEAIRLDPTNALAYAGRGVAYQHRGHLDRAIADFSHAIRLAPTLAIAYCGRGRAYQEKGDLAGTIVDQTEAIRLDGKLAAAYLCRGIAYGKKRDVDKAIADLSDAIRLDPELAEAYKSRGDVYLKKGEKDKAGVDFTRAKELGYTE
jgi:Tfp pilus assembly protein PilF